MDLCPLVVLFGQSAAGKSNLLDALQLLSTWILSASANWTGPSGGLSRTYATRFKAKSIQELTRVHGHRIPRMSQTDGNYLWPRTLRRPLSPKVVYLDLNHWIALAKALSGHDDGRENIALLDFCRKVAEEKTAIFPISESIYVEILKIKDYQKRCDLRKAVELLGRFIVVTSRAIIVTHEIEALLDRIVGPNPEPINTMDCIDWGVFGAIGRAGGIRVESSDGRDVTSEVRRSFADGPQTFDKIVSEAILNLNRQVIDGPSPVEDFKLRKRGYSPEKILEAYEQEAASEVDFAHRLNHDLKWRRGRLRDVVSAREVQIQINSIFKRGCDERGIGSLQSLRSCLPSATNPRRAFDSMPSFDASVTLKSSLHKNARHRWTQNDVHDIHALAVALPYCDIVVTDRAMASHAVQTKLADRLNTIVLSRLPDLRQHL